MGISKIFEVAVTSLKPFMLNKGYAFREITIRPSQVGGDKYYEASFYNEHTEISIHIAYAPANQQFEDYITVTFENSKGENFLLSDYFAKHSLFQEKDCFLLVGYDGDISEKLSSFILFIKNALSNEVKSLFIDGEWESVEFDWGTFK